MSKVDGLTKKEAFQMILDKLFDDEEITSEFLEDTFDKITENKPHTGIIKKLNDKFHEDEKETGLLDKINEDKETENDKTSNVKKTCLNFMLAPDEKYDIPPTYQASKPIVLTDDGYFEFKGNKKQSNKHPLYVLLKIFFNIDQPDFLKKSYDKIRDLDVGLSMFTKMKITDAILKSMKHMKGETWDTIKEVLNHEYSVPLELTFSSANNTLFINGKDTHISLEDVKKYTNRVNDSIHPYDEMILIMNEAKEIKNKKYLYYILNNSGNDHIGDILQNTTLKYDKYGRAVV